MRRLLPIAIVARSCFSGCDSNTATRMLYAATDYVYHNTSHRDNWIPKQCSYCDWRGDWNHRCQLLNCRRHRWCTNEDPPALYGRSRSGKFIRRPLKRFYKIASWLIPGENFSHNFYTNWNIFQKYSEIFEKFTSSLKIFHTILKYSEICQLIIFKKYF